MYSDPQPLPQIGTQQTSKLAVADGAVEPQAIADKVITQVSADAAFIQTSGVAAASPSMGGHFYFPPVSTPGSKSFKLFGKQISPTEVPCAPGQSKTSGAKFKNLVMKGKELFSDRAAGYANSHAYV